MSVLAAPTVKVRRPRQSAAERQRVYDDVTARDYRCRALVIDSSCRHSECFRNPDGIEPEPWPLERHHAGNKIGTRRITDPRHVVLLCQYHHKIWAPTHSRLILQYLKDVEDARDKARKDFEEDGVPA